MNILSFAIFLVFLVVNNNAESIEQVMANPLNVYVETDNSGKLIGNSGARIALIDLKLENAATLASKYKLPQNIIQRLQPLIGLSGQSALNKLQQNPIKFSQQEYNLIENNSKSYWLNRMQQAPENVKRTPEFISAIKLINQNMFPTVLDQTQQYRELHPDRL